MKRVDEKKAEQKELDERYRDRAAERRTGESGDYAEDEKLLSSYKSMGPDGDET